MPSQIHRWILSLTVASIVILAGCAFSAQQPPATTQPVASQPPTSTPVAPTPTPLPPTSAPSPMPSLVGPEWVIAFDGDLNHDGQRDVVAYTPAPIQPNMDSLSEQERTAYPFAIAEAVIVQEGEQGTPTIQVSISPQGVSVGPTVLFSAEQFGTPAPSAFLMRVSAGPQSDVLIECLPLNASGSVYAQGFGLYWNEGQLAYRLMVGGEAVPPPDVPPGSTLPLTPPPPDAPPGSTLPLTTPPPSETQSPDEIEIVLYWFMGETLQPEYRRIPHTLAVGTAALELLLAGPPPGLSTAIPTPDEVQNYAGRQADWGGQVRLLGLTIEQGVATANFSQEMNAYGGGSARVTGIREQITRTLQQFPTVDEVQIAIEGETDGVLQP